MSASARLRGIGTVASLEFRLRLRTDRWRWVLAAAFVLPAVFATVARIGFDVSAAPGARNPGTTAFCCAHEPFDPMRSIRERVDDLQVADYGHDLLTIAGLGRRDYGSRSPAPYGLAAYGLLGAGSVLVTVRRLRAPARTVPEGVRVA